MLRLYIMLSIAFLCIMGCSEKQNSEELYSQGLKHYSLNELDQAEKIFKEVIKQDSSHFNALLMLTKISYYNKDYSSGIDHADSLLKKSPLHSGALYWKARCLIMANPDLTEEPVKLLKKSLESDSNNIRARQLLALIYEREGKYKEAMHQYFEALKDEETLVNLRVNLALMYRKLGLKDKSTTEIGRALNIAREAGIPEKRINDIKEEIKK